MYLNLVIVAWTSLPPCVTPGKLRPGSTQIDESEEPEGSLTPRWLSDSKRAPLVPVHRTLSDF
jgi:hypothetical protein